LTARTAELVTRSRQLYAGAGWRWRVLQSLRPRICPFDELLDLVPPGSRLLDAGCGAGQFLLFLASEGLIARGLGFDTATTAIRVAQRAAESAKLSGVVGFEERSVESGFPAGDWTVVSAIDVVHHIPPAHQERFIRDLAAATPRGARLIIKDMVTRPLWRAAANQAHDLVMARQWVHQVSPETVRGWALGDSGLRLVHERRTDLLWYGHWTLVLERPA
jgi:2-polyprenyl-3-methyl-5-hydroxy-6-metoxy-1,4-benzoquinol methylase